MDHNHLTLFQTISVGLFGIIFGIFETFTNLFFLIKRDFRFSRIQHGRELPKEASDRMMYRKVIQMLILGILLLLISFVSILIAPQFFVIAGVLIFLSGLLDYSKYRKSKFFLIWGVIAILCVLSAIMS
ncbi:MAG: hypothetical protein ACW97P_02910 [Candidatus Hodarchaeales archaeon]|jgi:hypothetical protein